MQLEIGIAFPLEDSVCDRRPWEQNLHVGSLNRRINAAEARILTESNKIPTTLPDIRDSYVQNEMLPTFKTLT